MKKKELSAAKKIVLVIQLILGVISLILCIMFCLGKLGGIVALPVILLFAISMLVGNMIKYKIDEKTKIDGVRHFKNLLNLRLIYRLHVLKHS